jgi:phospholipid/cholesterol/gamma-HCH transport system substrate-binding protein
MRSRTVREGSVGLLILVGLGLFAGLILWLRGLSIGQRSYRFFIEFANTGGLEVGAPVRYRGVNVGKITATRPGPNGVEVEVEVSPTDLQIPKDVKVEASQSGLLGSTFIQINPNKPLAVATAAKPLDRNCDSSLIICNKDRIPGQVGVSVDELIRAATRFADVYSDPKFFSNVNAVAQNTAEAALEVAKLSREFGATARVAKQEISTFSSSARAIQQTANKLGLTADQVNSLLVNNRATLVSTLENINQITAQLRTTTANLNPIVNRIQQGQLLQNLEVLAANSAEASASLRDVSKALNSPANILALQQTLDSARSTFLNAQKITADLDELTGDPSFRDNLRRLVVGLSRLVSSTQQLHQQSQYAQILSPLAAIIDNPDATTPNDSATSVDKPKSSMTSSTENSQSHENPQNQ